ncbi:MAG: hypothetical protein JXM73_25780 [Anaerolineae bacterium]|nr:hypothetical protein [Anaerolineae bacterium]
MRVSIINLELSPWSEIGACVIDQARFFQRRGDDARVYVLRSPQASSQITVEGNQVPADVAAAVDVVKLDDLTGGRQEHFRLSDLYIYHFPGYYDLLEGMRQIERGTVILYCHSAAPPGSWTDRESALVHDADFCIVDSHANRQELAKRSGYDPDQIYLLPPVGPEDLGDLERYESDLAEIVRQTVIYTLPEIPTEPPRGTAEGEKEPSPTTSTAKRLDELLGDIEARSDVAWRGYEVRSKAPLIGPLIAWVRRNLTSHLREPYLDPTIERQVAFNRQVAGWLRQARDLISDCAQRQAELEARVHAVEADSPPFGSQGKGDLEQSSCSDGGTM